MKISYCTTVFNRFWQLKETLISNLKKLKDHPDTELILINFNGDDSDDITNLVEKTCAFELMSGKLKYYIRKEPWDKFHVALAKNRAYQFATGDIFVNLDCDNFIHKNDPNIVRNHYSKNPNPENLIFHQTSGTSALKSKYINSRYHLFNEDEIDYSQENTIYDGTFGRITIHRAMFEKLNGYNENLMGMGMEDMDLIIRGIKLGGEYKFKEIVNFEGVRNFIPQDDQYEEHNNNQINWKLMDKYLEKENYSPQYEITETDDLYQKFVYDYDIEKTRDYKLTLFTSFFKCDEFAESFSNNILEQTAFENTFFIIFYFINSSNNKNETNKIIFKLNKKENIKVFFIHYDLGLYNSWNEMIKLTRSEWLGNFNPDDLRSPNYCEKVLEWITENPLADIITGTYKPVYKKYNNFLEAFIENDEIWFNNQIFMNNEGKIKYNKFDFKKRYITLDEMFQLVKKENGDYKIETFCVPNSAPIWKRELHDKFGFFKEKMNGCYTDFFFWLVCLKNGANLLQFNETLSLFYINENQAHRKMDNNELIFNRIILKFGNSHLKKMYFKPIIDNNSVPSQDFCQDESVGNPDEDVQSQDFQVELI